MQYSIKIDLKKMKFNYYLINYLLVPCFSKIYNDDLCKKKNPRTSCENQRLSRSTFQRFIYDSCIINWDDTISIKKEVYKFKFDTNFCF